MKAIKLKKINIKTLLATILIEVSFNGYAIEKVLPADVVRLMTNHLNADDTGNLRITCERMRTVIPANYVKTKRFNEIVGFFYSYEKGAYLPDANAETKLIEIQEDFELGDLITQEAWVDIMGVNPSRWKTRDICPDDYIENYHGNKGISVCKNWPITNVNYHDIQNFIQKINQRNPDKRYNYRLPTEFEYEYAARGGRQADPSIYTGTFGKAGFEDFAAFRDLANVDGKRNYDEGPGKINQYPGFPRVDGAHDLLGTVYSLTNSEDDGGASALVIRGCLWYFSQACVRAANRSRCYPRFSNEYVGLRLLRTSS